MKSGRLERLMKNTVSSLIFQITTIFCGFVLPRYILQYFGSEVNGLVGSISQFLQLIAFLELGVGAVVQSSLYKPLTEKDDECVSTIIVSANNFFKKLACILLVYVCILMVVYPSIAKQNFSHMYTALLIAAMSISSFAQYYFGVVDRLLLTADQKGYIQYNAQTVTMIANTIACVILIRLSASIHMVKLMTSLIYLVRPFALRIYVNKYYNIDRNIQYVGEPIKQKWNGVAQHIAAVVLDGTDTIVLTLFTSLSMVSIYNVYHLVVHGVKQLFISLTNGFQSLLGELWAKQELEELNRTFGWTEWFVHTGVTFIFGCTAMLIVPFVKIYTLGINDAQYVQPMFALLITLAQAGHCLRLPYNLMILAGGHYKNTQHSYIAAALLNIIISIIAVYVWGLIGVAIGTLIAMLYQTVWMAYYDSKNLLKWPLKNVAKQVFVDILTIILAGYITSHFKLDVVNYIAWVILAVKTAFIWGITTLFINSIFYKEKLMFAMKKCREKVKH